MKYSILKIPFDACIVEKERRGASKGPDAIEAELKNFFSFDEIKNKIEFFEVKEKNDFEKMHKEVESAASNAYKKGNFVIGLGGDHSVSYGLMKAFAKQFPKNMGLIYFDAHFDCQDDFLPPTHEDILRAIIKENLLGKNILHIGARNFTEKEQKFIVGKVWFDLAELFYTRAAPENVVEHIKEFVKTVDNIYISIDIDVIDQTFAPGTGWPEPAGILPQHLLHLLNYLKSTKKVCGIDIVEVSPRKDVNNMTARLAARILLEFLK